MKFMIETSARHIHLTQETVEKLLGAGYQLTKRKDLSYPGQFACNERVPLVGPKKEMANVSILGPVRKAEQVEVSGSDARALGIDAPVRESGHVEGSGACKLIGPAGEVELKEATLYTAFRRLEAAGLIQSYWGSETSGARRRYYAITALVQEKLISDLAALEDTKRQLDQLFEG